MEHPHPPDVTVFLWDRVALKLNLVLHSVPSPVAPFDSTRIAWADIPMCLAERGLLLQGLPAVCLPTPDNYALDDRVSDSLSLWSNERLQALDSALTTRTLTIVPREPLGTSRCLDQRSRVFRNPFVSQLVELFLNLLTQMAVVRTPPWVSQKSGSIDICSQSRFIGNLFQ